jgi:hypothetical protein
MKKIVRFLTLACCIAVLGIASSCSKEDNGQDNGTNNSNTSEYSYPGNFEEIYSYFNKTIGSSDSAKITAEFLQQGFSFVEDDRPCLHFEKKRRKR